jgi:RNA polymerase sigma-70 factor, ECF subfamily
MNTAVQASTGAALKRSETGAIARATRPFRRSAARKHYVLSPATDTKPANKPLKPDSAALSQAIRLAQQGNAAAFEEIYRLHSRRVYALCLRMVSDPTEAEDLTQEAFLQLFRKIHTFRGESAFSSWLHRLTANVVLMRFRKKKPVATSLDEMSKSDDERETGPREIATADLRLSGVFDRVNLHTAIEQLPEGYKTMFILHDVHGYEHNEIAEILGCSIGNSKSQLHKARKRLRELLNRLKHFRPGHGREAGCAALAVADAY